MQASQRTGQFSFTSEIEHLHIFSLAQVQVLVLPAFASCEVIKNNLSLSRQVVSSCVDGLALGWIKIDGDGSDEMDDDGALLGA